LVHSCWCIVFGCLNSNFNLNSFVAPFLFAKTLLSYSLTLSSFWPVSALRPCEQSLLPPLYLLCQLACVAVLSAQPAQHFAASPPNSHRQPVSVRPRLLTLPGGPPLSSPTSRPSTSRTQVRTLPRPSPPRARLPSRDRTPRSSPWPI
jgi:hypothetical protein